MNKVESRVAALQFREREAGAGGRLGIVGLSGGLARWGLYDDRMAWKAILLIITVPSLAIPDCQHLCGPNLRSD